MNRFRFTLAAGSGDRLLPLDYSYFLSSYVYKTISKENPAYANWLHEKGYGEKRKLFKFFNFGTLVTKEYKIHGDRLKLLHPNLSWELSFAHEEAALPFIRGLFLNNTFRIGDEISSVEFRVNQIECLPCPEFQEEMKYKTYSPVCADYQFPGEKYTTYLEPGHELYTKIIYNNLISKYNILFPDKTTPEGEFEIELLSETKRKVLQIQKKNQKPVRVKGYTFTFKLKAHPELQKLAYYAGIGKENSMGFGCLGIRD
ncbi:MAG: CRISPR-associated endoribonuclease Cas6 [Leptospiraceae bacterium]|nr:CRISPR-associated endoribonuclease Cas6 [Leptospiraceae bacterium]MCP5503404.1 CRISPR-associated endoribonuclease Cas6 [Leptospiraceae bacterium]